MRRHLAFLAGYGRALLRHHVEITATFLALASIVLVSAAAMYWAEAPHGTFPSYWTAVYWATTTVTTVGYGDFVPVSPAGQVVAVVTAVLGAGFLVITAGILASWFVKAMRP